MLRKYDNDTVTQYKKRKGNFMQTYTGLHFYPLDPQPAEIRIADIAHHLAHVCRFSGAVKRFYSVAQHCVIVSRLCPPEMRLWGLLHDASEAYVGDMVRPLKLSMPKYKTVERGVMAAVIARFGLSPTEPVLVKHYDQVVCVTEARDLMGNPEWASHGPIGALKGRIKPQPPEQAKREFLAEYRKLTRAA